MIKLLFLSLVQADFLEKIAAEAVPSAKRAGISVYFEKPQGIPEVIADQQKLAIAMANLIENAVRYNIKNGQILIRAEKLPNEPFVQVSVKDTGIGMPKEDLGKLFSKFFRAEGGIKAQADGSGLGLYITRNIIQAHGGRIWVESEPERGTTFYFVLATDPSRVPRRETP